MVIRLIPTLLLSGLIALAAMVPRPALAQADESRLPALAAELDQQEAETPATPPEPDSDILFPTLPENFVADADTLAAIQSSVQGYFHYRTAQYQHRLNIFRWQHVSTQVIFGVVILIVAMGLYFSWMQFKASDHGKDIGSSAFEASQSGFKVTSPVLGVIILALSLAFFYLYLIYVYPVTDAF